MDSTKNNYRMAGYLLFACGLINLRYQWGQSDVLLRSAIIFIPGAAVIMATFIPSLTKNMELPAIKITLLALGLLIVTYAITN